MVVINSIYFCDARPCIKYIDRPDQGPYSDVRTNRVPKVANDTATCYFCIVLIHHFNDFDTVPKIHVLWSTRYSYTDCTRFSRHRKQASNDISEEEEPCTERSA